MQIFVLGVNHKTAPVEIRERLAVPASKAPEFLRSIEETRLFRERVLLSTCNRTEIYGVADFSDDIIPRLKQILCDYSRMDLSLFEDKLYVLQQPDSVSHLFTVASGLDSMVLGETEITGQVKEAYLQAHQQRQTGKVLNALFQRSLKVAKNVRTHTEVGAGRVGVASVAVDLAEKIFESLKGARVLVVGTGEMAGQVTRALVGRGARAFIASSHHFERAESMAHELGGEALPFDRFDSKMSEIDVLITSTHASCFFADVERVKFWMKVRHGRPLFIVDIALPRNVDAGAEKIDNVYLYNVDDLQGIADKNQSFRRQQLEECNRRVETQTQYFMNWLAKEFGSS